MMTRIAVALLIGLGLTGSVSALSTTTPVADSSDKVTLLPPPARAAAPPAPKPEIVRSGNPLWGIPLRQFTASVARPLFAPTRRPPPPPATPVSRAAPPPPPKLEPEKPLLSLVGTVAVGASDGIGLFIDQGAKTVVRLKMGEGHNGWILRNVQRREVVLEKGRAKVVLTLPPLETKMSVGAGGPVAPAVAVQTSPPPPPPVSPAAAALPPAGAGAQAGPTGADLPTVSTSADGASPFAGLLQLLANRQAR
jgi:hypothetical protein